MMLPYWLTQSLQVFPLACWIYFGLGIPWALVALPRAAWPRKAEALALAFAFGPALLTIWSFVLGSIGGAFQIYLLRFDLILSGTILMALLGTILAWKKKHSIKALPEAGKTPFTFDEKLLLGLILVLLCIISVVSMYWPFTAYDTLWVYGYEGRLYTLHGYIPTDIGYYPQFLPLQYNFLQSLSGEYNDHAARMVVPFLYLGSVLATYNLGEQMFSRRVGIYTAAIWAFYPHAAHWAQVGDLEIPVTFLFTMSSVYFLRAWTETETNLRRRYALISGICFGIAMWTKPTAGAFILGVLLLLLVDFLLIFRIRSASPDAKLREWRSRLELALITGIASIPLGALWYGRNLLLGLPALVFPHENWLKLATRSGDLLSWPLLSLFLLIVYLAGTRKLSNAWILLLGVLLILFGAMPSSPLIDPARRDAPMSYIRWYEALAIIGGLILIGWNLRKYVFPAKIAWLYLLILPYFLTWFWSYSYHARLSFAIVPLLILPSALLIAKFRPRSKLVHAGLLICVSFYALSIPIWGIAPFSDWLWTDRYPDDNSKYNVHNGDLFQMALFISSYRPYNGRDPIIIAPGEQRLRFFFPELKIITDTLPTNLDDLSGATHFVYGTLARWRYEDMEIQLESVPLISSLARQEIFDKIYDFENGNFEYELYELHFENRFEMPDGGQRYHLIEDEVVFGGNIQFLGDIVGNTRLAGNTISLEFLWQTISQPAENYFLRLSLLNTLDNTIVASWDSPLLQVEEIVFQTSFWGSGEYLVTRHQFTLDNWNEYERGQDIYKLLVNLINRDTNEVVEIEINGLSAQAYPMEARFSN